MRTAVCVHAVGLHGNGPIHGGEGRPVVADELAVLRVFALHGRHCVWTRLGAIGSMECVVVSMDGHRARLGQESSSAGECGERL